MLRGTPQINAISAKAGNGPSLCGGAALANALILSSTTKEKAAKNAEAIRKADGKRCG